MRYSYEYKRKCVELYREGKWPETPEGIKNQNDFRKMVRTWCRMEDANGPEVLQHKPSNKVWTPEAKLELVAQVLAGQSVRSVAIEAGIVNGLLYQWVRRYKMEGYNGLITRKKGRPTKEPAVKMKKPRKLDESEYEELIRLRAESAYIKAENAVIKKEITLREAKEAARLKARKQQSSKNSEQQGTP